MKLVVIAHPKTGVKEAFIDGLKVGVFEQLDSESEKISFVSGCSHEKLSGDHYILIGQHLKSLNS